MTKVMKTLQFLCALAVSAAMAAASPGPAHAQATDGRNLRPVAASVAANPQQRLALVIGNAAYKQSPLLNPVNDVRAVSKALQDSGFTVITRENADQATMVAALREFGDRLRGGGTGLFYFSGHGMQIKGRNYLVPVDAAFEREDEIAYRTVDAQAVLDKMEAAGNPTNIMILDSCRTNPFLRGSRSGQQGLARMDAPSGSLVAYATSPGAVASDGTGVNGLYTHHLLQAMRQPGSKIEDVFKLVRTNVRRESAGAQVPWEETSLEGDFYFIGGSPVIAAQEHDPLERILWDVLRTSGTPEDVSAFLSRYPAGRYASDARARLSQMSALTAPPQPVPPLASVPAPATGAGAVLVAAALPSRPPPASNAAGYQTGDRWRYQIVDKFKGEVVRNYSNTVDSILPDGSMSINGGRMRWDANGNVRSIDGAELEDTYAGHMFMPTELVAGHKTALAYELTRRSASGNAVTDAGKGTMTVKAREKVMTPAGEFEAWRVEIESWGSTHNANSYRASQGGGIGWRMYATGWYVPELRNYAAYNQEMRMASGLQNSSTNTFSQRERHELTSFSVRGAGNLSASR